MSRAGSAKVLAAGAAWRLTGAPHAGRALARSAAHGAENERALAGILLVRAGDRSVPVLTDALLAGSAAPELVTVLASIGSAAARAALARVAAAEPVAPQVASAAAAAVRTLDRQRAREGRLGENPEPPDTGRP